MWACCKFSLLKVKHIGSDKASNTIKCCFFHPTPSSPTTYVVYMSVSTDPFAQVASPR